MPNSELVHSFFHLEAPQGALVSPMQHQLAACLPTVNPADIPLSFCFNRPGLGLRSAIALKLAAKTGQRPIQFTEQLVACLGAFPQPNGGLCWQAIAVDTGWLELWLQPDAMGLWLNQLLEAPGPLTGPFSPDLLFSCRFLQQRCLDLAQLAQEHCALDPQWQFSQNAELTQWEQSLLEAIACLSSAHQSYRGKPHLLDALERAIWGMIDHCTLFYFLRQWPQQGCHYWQWHIFINEFLRLYLPGA